MLAFAFITTAVFGGKSDLACSLNGVLESGTKTCACDKPWKGSACDKLDIRPRPVGAVPAYGYSPNVTSWGGNIIKNDAGSYDMWVSEMVGKDCGLNTWLSNSRIVHATAETLDLTTAFKHTDTPLEVWAHNAAPVRAPASHTPCPGCYYLFHIGTGAPSGRAVKNCTGTADSNGQNKDRLLVEGDPEHVLPMYTSSHLESWHGGAGSLDASNAASSGLVHRSKTPDGPWTPLPAMGSCNNPAPAFARNGSLYVLCNSATIWRSDAPEAASGWVKVADVDLNASPWVTPSTSDYIRIEDPYIYQDSNGNWHLLCHRYDYRDGYPVNPNQSEPVLVSGHAFSTDLKEWHYSMGPQPFDPWVEFEDGTRQNFSTFERPHLVFDASGVPTHSVHGASPVWNQYGGHHPCEVCPRRQGSNHSCVVCKSSTYYSWTYTLTQELNV